MKKMLAAVLSVLMVSSMAFAAPAQQLDIATMSKADSQFLFKADADAAVLDKQEMVETEGEFFPVILGLGFYSVAYLNAPSYNDRIYSGYPYAITKQWRWLNW